MLNTVQNATTNFVRCAIVWKADIPEALGRLELREGIVSLGKRIPDEPAPV
jgi:hypothetical protein